MSDELRRMSFPDAIKSVLTKYVGFSGRARRSEFWWFQLFFAIVYGVPMVVNTVDKSAAAFGGLVLLGLALPSVAVTVRRLHDIDRSAWFYLVVLVPIAGIIVLLVLACMDSSRNPNRYGPSPKYA
jgi:uncharacterized membrane protein YhaH (DUF805 family)